MCDRQCLSHFGKILNRFDPYVTREIDLKPRFTRSYPTAVDILYRASHGSLLRFTHGRPCDAQYSISTAVGYLHVKRGFKSISRVTYGSNRFKILPKCDRHCLSHISKGHKPHLTTQTSSSRDFSNRRITNHQLIFPVSKKIANYFQNTVYFNKTPGQKLYIFKRRN
jgi:hypothetical protein